MRKFAQAHTERAKEALAEEGPGQAMLKRSPETPGPKDGSRERRGTARRIARRIARRTDHGARRKGNRGQTRPELGSLGGAAPANAEGEGSGRGAETPGRRPTMADARAGAPARTGRFVSEVRLMRRSGDLSDALRGIASDILFC